MGKSKRTVSVTIVTYHSEPFAVRCLESIFAQDWPSLEVVVVDNNSRDRTPEILSAYQGRARIILNKENRGFAAAQNQAIRRAGGDWVLVLNPDVVLAPDFISTLVQGGMMDPDIGTVCGKLYRALPNLDIPPSPRLDSAGIYFTPTFRHLDRGMHEQDREDYSRPAFVFGATAAAALYRRSMIEDVSVDGEFFDEDFYLYREDADLSWRAQLLGWRCLYLPQAVGYHVRRVFPGCRRSLPAGINRHSVKNRFLMRMKNTTWPLYLRNFLPVTARDLGILFYCLVAEQSSLGAFAAVLRIWKRTWAKRRLIQQRRRVSDANLRKWFRFRPVTEPVTLPLRPHEEPVLVRAPAGRSAALPVPAARQRGGLSQLQP